MDKLQKILEADSPEGLEDLAVKRIKELNDSDAEKSKKIDELEKRLADEGADEGAEDKDKGKEGEDEDKDKDKDKGEEDKDKGKGEGEETDEAKALKEKDAEIVKLKEELEAAKKADAEKADAVKTLKDSVEKLEKRTDAIGKKQVRPLFHDSDDKIEELKKARGNIYADARKVK